MKATKHKLWQHKTQPELQVTLEEFSAWSPSAHTGVNVKTEEGDKKTEEGDKKRRPTTRQLHQYLKYIACSTYFKSHKREGIKPTHMADWFAGLPANHEVPSSRPALVAGSV